MCLQCDGYSYEEAMQALDLRIRVHGWVLQQVVDDDAGITWSYTIGLVENYGHPELAMLDVKASEQNRVLRLLVDGIVRHGAISDAMVTLERLEVVDVHLDHLQSELFGTWGNRYGFLPPPGSFRQVLLPSSAFCACHADAVTRLDKPGPLPPRYASQERRPNRAERRRRRG